MRLLPVLVSTLLGTCKGFQVGPFQRPFHQERISFTKLYGQNLDQSGPLETANTIFSRRSALTSSFQVAAAASALNSFSFLFAPNANAAIGSLPEFSDTNAVLTGMTVNVADQTQQDDMIAFLENGFGMKKVNQSKKGSVTDTWLAFGPTEMYIPEDWEPAVSSFSNYGGHATIRVRYDKDTTEAFYTGADTTGDNVAYIQLGVPEYRISQMVKNGGNVYNGYGIVEVISPSGVPIRGIIGISPDPVMFVALNCASVKDSKAFYEQLGFREQEYPYCRPNKGQGQFEPPQPKKSVYMAPSNNCMGVLLLQAKKPKSVKPNPAVGSLNIVYQPSENTTASGSMKVIDPNLVPISFDSYFDYEKTERESRVLSIVKTSE